MLAELSSEFPSPMFASPLRQLVRPPTKTEQEKRKKTKGEKKLQNLGLRVCLISYLEIRSACSGHFYRFYCAGFFALHFSSLFRSFHLDPASQHPAARSASICMATGSLTDY